MNRQFCALAAIAVAAIALGACGSSSPEVASTGDTVIPVCHWPAEVDTFDDASGNGCLPRSMFEVCEVPNGSVIHPDGSIATPDGETVTCDDECSPTEFSLTCHGSSPSQIPRPRPQSDCRVVPVPTPSGTLFFCCPCAP